MVVTENEKKLFRLLVERPDAIMPSRPHGHPTDNSVIERAEIAYQIKNVGEIKYGKINDIPDDIMKDVFEYWKGYYPCPYLDKIKDPRALKLAREAGFMTEKEELKYAISMVN